MAIKSSVSAGTNTSSNTLWRGRQKKPNNQQRTAYSEFEIVRSFRQSEFKRKQIELLAELNACSKDTIKEILIKHGCEIPEVYHNGKEKKKEEEPVEETAKKKKVTKKTEDIISQEEQITEKEIVNHKEPETEEKKRQKMPDSVKTVLEGRVEELTVVKEKLKEQRRQISENIDKVTIEMLEILEFMDDLEEGENEQGTLERTADARS